jgi:hypothetical protein
MLMDLHWHAKLNRKRSILNRKAGPLQARPGRRRVWATLLLIAFTSCLSKDYSVAVTDNSIPNLKLYAYNKFKTYDQFDCYNYIIIRESNWNYKARSGSHYGLGQMRNNLVLTLTPKQQIDLHYKYIAHRYGIVNGEPNACLAAEHLDTYGWH